ncbi:hypothetical protein [Chondromyces crocatus]|uniref:hypothetical protein n=1 Tax=Chondromyces crocatus TaxID=52 RepID=UPI0012E32DE3|nr:hypothetical protein [Chondromyces crocatus]
MRREIALRFEPHSGRTVVSAEAYVDTLRAVFDGLGELRRAAAPVFALHRGWPTAQVRQALELSVGRTHDDKLLVPLIVGASEQGAHLDIHVLASMFWRLGARSLRQAAAGRATSVEVTASCAEAFARAAHCAEEGGHSRLLLVVRGPVSPHWRTVADLSKLAPGLHRHAARRATAKRAQAQMLGQLVALDHTPPTVVIATPYGRRTVALPEALRQDARQLWGEEVIVDVEAAVTSEGQLHEATALRLRRARRVADAVEDHERSRGALGEVWGTDDVREYLDSLWPRSS